MAYKKITSRMTQAALKATDWAAIDEMSDRDVARQIDGDEDVAPELLPIDVKAIRSATGLSQGNFAKRYKIPVGTLRDWEQGRKHPDTTARAYLWVIGRNPKMVAESLKG